MTDKKDKSTDSATLKFAGREFPETVEGRRQLEEYGQQLATLAGRQSNEVGQARKSLAKYQRIEAQLPEAIKVVLESPEASDDAKLLAQYMYQEKLSAVEKSDSSRKDEWYSQAAESVLEEMPELKDTYDVEVIDAVLRKYSVHSAEDPLSEAKRILSSKVKKASPKKEEDSGHVSVDGSSGGRRAPTSEEKSKESKDSDDTSYLY
jgi:hypothetical protein